MAIVLVVAGLPAVAGAGPASAETTRDIPAAGSTAIRPAAPGVDTGIQDPELRGEPEEGAAAKALTRKPQGPDRSLSHGVGRGEKFGANLFKSNPKLALSFQGISHRDQRLANGGNQFSLEPPDQGLCAGNGFVIESVNDALRVYGTNGAPLTGVQDLNTFYGYAPAINRTTGESGPFVTDPSCYYDPDVKRWFHVVLTLEVEPDTGDFTGNNTIDIAVSKTASPLGDWTIYHMPVQDDGTQGTPNHGPLCPCIGDYPHIGADLFGFYVTTNEYPFFDDGFIGAQIYAFPKSRFVTSPGTVPVTQYDTSTLGAGGNPGFTIWPAQSPNSQYAPGLEYFLSSDAAEEANGSGTSNHIIQWTLTGTFLLNLGQTPKLTTRVLPVKPYSLPPRADQKAGDFPLGQCVNDTTTPTPLGPGCWRLLFDEEPAHNEVESTLDSNDTRMQQVYFAAGKLWAALDTAVQVGGKTKAGIEWFVVNPFFGPAKSDYLALANNNLTYPAVGVTAAGKGVMAFTVAGADHFPSAGYAALDAVSGAGAVQIAAEGKWPQDGFSGYKAFGDPPRPRWGDYGAAVAVGNTMWIASEYIENSCTLAQFVQPPLLSCGSTRTALANWTTRISSLTL